MNERRGKGSAYVTFPLLQATATYTLEKRYRYTYPAPIRNLRNRMIIVPPAVRNGQEAVSVTLHVSGQLQAQEASDVNGNRIITLEAENLENGFTVEMSAAIVRNNDSRSTFHGDSSRFLHHSHLTSTGPELKDAARVLKGENPSSSDLALAIRKHVHRHMRYAFGETTVDTTATEAYAIGAGLCQDYTHIMIAMCRSVGIPARYVSGHLAGEQGGSHAWVETIHTMDGRSIAQGHDPTNDCEAGIRHIYIASGMDYTDVAPTSGTYDAEVGGSLEASTSIRLLQKAS